MAVDRMTIERLTEILSAYGADPLRWPEGERLAAQALAAREPRAAALVAEAAALDALLDEAPGAAPSPALIAAVLKRRPKRHWLVRAWNELFPDTPAWRPAAGLAAALVLGFGLQAAAADRLGLGESEEVASADEGRVLAPLSGSELIEAEEAL
jgi:hypothetical protein